MLVWLEWSFNLGDENTPEIQYYRSKKNEKYKKFIEEKGKI